MSRSSLFLLLLLATLSTAPANAQKAKKKSAAKTTQTTKPTKKQLQAEQQQTTAARKKSQAQATQLNKNIQTAIDSVLILDHRLAEQQTVIDSLNKEIRTLQGKIAELEQEMSRLRKELAEKKERYARAMVHMQRHRKLQNKLMFIFSAKNFEQMLRRLRYTREYSAYQQAQGQIIKQQQAEVHRKQNELLAAKTKLETHRVAVEEKVALLEEGKKNQQQQVAYLNKNLKAVKQQIKTYQDKEAKLNAQIEQLIQEEIAEAKRKAEEERKRKEEAARRAAEAERKRLAEAKAALEKAEAEKRKAEEAAKAAQTDTERTKAKEAVKNSETALRNAKSEERAASKALEKAEKASKSTAADWTVETADTKLSANFASNKGKLPMPVSGSYSIVGHYGRYTVEGLSHVQLDNKGIDIRCQNGAQARAIFDGTVSGVYQLGGKQVILIRHGDYISVYSGLKNASVSKGQKVTTRQTLGEVANNDSGKPTLHFQLRKLSERLNPEQWLKAT